LYGHFKKKKKKKQPSNSTTSTKGHLQHYEMELYMNLCWHA
jgi:hypothetical protein